jgi:protein-tyrosine-phosphatase
VTTASFRVHLSRQTAENVNNLIAASWNLEKNSLAPFFRGLSKKCHLAKRVSLLCLPDSAQIAQGFRRTFAGDEFVAKSATTRSLEAGPLAREVMQEVGIYISGQHAQDIKESLTEHFSYVVTVCDASREKFPQVLNWRRCSVKHVARSRVALSTVGG